MLLTCAAWAPPVLAQEGNGLYEPFPQPRAESRAQAFADKVGVSATADELRDGVFVGRSLAPAAPVRPPDASRRAGVEASATAVAGLLLAALAALGLAVLAAGRSRIASSAA